MNKNLLPLLVLFIALPAILTTDCRVSGQAAATSSSNQQLVIGTGETINLDGDVSFTEAENRALWNPHSTGLTNDSIWTVTFDNETEIFIETAPIEAGHVATGAWWTTSFKSKSLVPLYGTEPMQLLASFRANIVSINCQTGNEWLRIALASAVRRSNGAVVYTEMDFWDSTNVTNNPAGNLRTGGNTIYQGGDVVEYKIDQLRTGQWTSYSLDLTRQVDSAWTLKPGDSLESVYIVVEVIGSVSVTLKIDDLFVTQLG
jgi:hypothetical protein